MLALVPGSGNGPFYLPGNCCGYRMPGKAYADFAGLGGQLIRQRIAGFKHKCQPAGPESVHYGIRSRRDMRHQRFQLTLFDFYHPFNGLRIKRICTQAIKASRRKCKHPTLPDNSGCFGDDFRFGLLGIYLSNN
jgi:hypothetical protein